QKKSFSLLQTVATAAVFSAISGWYGFMFGREAARQELAELVESLKNASATTRDSASSS
ncbi:hypothetical protein M569_11783, partial [Genlisea aurea]